MSFSLYDATVPSYLQILGAVSGFLDRSAAHFKQQGTPLDEIVESRIAPDMFPLRFQIVSVAHHSAGAIEAVKKGLSLPPSGMNDLDYAGLQALVTQARDALTAVSRDEVNALEGGDVVFQFGEHRMPFTAENFLMSFSLPNFYFHATTAYDVLRMKGAPLGKRNFLGQLRMKT